MLVVRAFDIDADAVTSESLALVVSNVVLMLPATGRPEVVLVTETEVRTVPALYKLVLRVLLDVLPEVCPFPIDVVGVTLALLGFLDNSVVCVVPAIGLAEVVITEAVVVIVFANKFGLLVLPEVAVLSEVRSLPKLLVVVAGNISLLAMLALLELVAVDVVRIMLELLVVALVKDAVVLGLIELVLRQGIGQFP